MIDKEELRNSFDLVKYVSNTTKLKQINGEWWGCCPLHSERTPSFHINKNGEEYFCHGCGEGGDSFLFVASYNGLDITRDFKRVCEIMGGSDYEIEPIEKKRRSELPKEPIKRIVESMDSIIQKDEKYILTKKYDYAKDLIKCRYDNEDNTKKTFRWYHKENDKWYYGKGGKANGLYWSKPIEENYSNIVFIAEGEKSADAVSSCGFVCVSASDGGDPNAEKWHNEYTQELKGYDVYVLNDDDCTNKEGNKGKMYADKVAYKIQDVANMVKRIDINDVLPNENSINGYDIADIVEEIGIEKTKEKLEKFLQAATFTDDEVNKTMIKTILGTTNDDIIKIVTTAVEEVMSTSNIGIGTEEQIAVIVKRTGVSKKTILAGIKKVVEERKKNLNNTIVVAGNEEYEVVTLGDEECDISGTGFLCQNGQIINAKTEEVVLPHKCVYYANVYDVEDNTYRDMLAFNTLINPYSVNFLSVNAEEIQNSQKVVGALAPHGIKITSLKSHDFIEFIQSMQIKQGVDTRQIREINRIGWYDGYLLPYESEQSSVIIKDGTNEKKIADAYLRTKGDSEKNIAMIKEVLESVSIAPIVLGTIISSLFMEKAGLKGQTHVLNISGMSGKGKSVLIKLLYSLLGDSVNSDDMYGGSDATVQSSQNTAGYLRNFALYLDDPMQAGREDSKVAQQRIYSFVNGTGRQRLNRFGDSRKYKEWYSNILYTNESSLFSSDDTVKGGVLSRILDVELEEEISQDNVNKWLVDIAKNNYGHFGIDFANMIRTMSKEDIIDMVQEEYEVFEKIGVDRKRGNTAAHIAVGFKMACFVLGINQEFPYNTVLKNVNKAGAISDGARAYIVFEAWLDGNLEKFRQVMDKNDVIWGTLDYVGKEKVVNIQISKLRDICMQLNIPRDSMIVHCIENKLIASDNGKNTRQVMARHDNIKVVSFYYKWNEPQNRDIEEEGTYFKPLRKGETVPFNN